MKKIILGGSIAIVATLVFGFYLKSADANNDYNHYDNNQNQGDQRHFNFDWPVNKNRPNDNHNGRIFNPDKQLSPSACGDHLGKPIIDVKQKVQNDADSGSGTPTYWAFDYYTRNIKVWPVGNWNVTGTWVSTHTFEGNTYTHNNTITQAPNSTLTGSGGWDGTKNGSAFSTPNTWVITSGSSISGNAIHFNYQYTSVETCATNGYVDAIIASDGSMTGTWHDDCGSGRTGAWTTAPGVAQGNDNNYCAIVTYNGDFYAVPGQGTPGNDPAGSLIDSSMNQPINGNMSGGYRATFTGTLASSPSWPTHGSVGTTNYQCNITGTVLVELTG